MDHYDAAHIAAFFDTYGEREWDRFEAAPYGAVNLFIHRHYLERSIRADMHVLDAGAGPGRFTLALAELGARVTVGDISAGQLGEHRRRLEEAGLEHAVHARHQCDITDLSRFGDAAFDAVVCYGGPVSYVMDRADDAVAELLRVTRPGGRVLLSVISKVGQRGRFCRECSSCTVRTRRLSKGSSRPVSCPKRSTTDTPSRCTAGRS